jgi:hypothetical protein
MCRACLVAVDAVADASYSLVMMNSGFISKLL